MARRSRHSLPGAIYHVMLRGNNGQSIFSSDHERCRFCLLMQEGVERYGHRILAFCFMTNHVHLAIQQGEVSISKICQNLAFRYTAFYNRRNKTKGHLFQGRFKSILVDGNSYLRQLIRYIHLNPVRAYITNDPQHYPWSSHQAYIMQNEFTWLARDEGLQLFGESHQEALELFNSYIMSGIGQKDEIDFKKGIYAGIIGDDLFIERMREENEYNCIEDGSLEINLKMLVSVVADRYQIDEEGLQSLGNDRKSSNIRSVLAYLARSTCGVSLKEVAIFCGREDNTMSQAASRLEKQSLKSERLKNDLEDLRRELSLAARSSLRALNYSKLEV